MVCSDGSKKPSLFLVFWQDFRRPEWHYSAKFGGSAANSGGSSANFGASKISQKACFSEKCSWFLPEKMSKIRSDGLKNHHSKPSLFKLLYFRLLKAKVMVYGLFPLFEWNKTSYMHHEYQKDNIFLQSSPWVKSILPPCYPPNKGAVYFSKEAVFSAEELLYSAKEPL